MTQKSERKRKKYPTFAQTKLNHMKIMPGGEGNDSPNQEKAL